MQTQENTKFNARQVAWAASHDWFSHVSPLGELYVWDCYVTSADSTPHRDLIQFNGSFSDLRMWAGY